MQQFFLVQTTTRDQLVHQGIFFKPEKPTKRALLWVHGLTGTFYSNTPMLNILADLCAKKGLAFASFNTRGHDAITGIKKVDPSNPKGYTYVDGGAGVEKFEECVLDIKGSLDFLEKNGYSEVLLVGHSTGSTKVSYYIATEEDKRVIGGVLLGPLSDRLRPDLGKEKLQNDIKLMQKLQEKGRGEIRQPADLVIGKTYFPLTLKRFLSIYTPGPEDQFDYGDKDPQMPYFSKITKPILVVLGDQDENLDRPAKDVIAVFDRLHNSQEYKSLIIPGATHSFIGKEEEVGKEIVTWVKTL